MDTQSKNNKVEHWNRVRKAPPACELYINHGDSESVRAEKRQWWRDVKSQQEVFDFNIFNIITFDLSSLSFPRINITSAINKLCWPLRINNHQIDRKVIAFGLNQSQHLVEVRERVLYEASNVNF